MRDSGTRRNGVRARLGLFALACALASPAGAGRIELDPGPPVPPGTGVIAVALADMDRDGHLDLVVASSAIPGEVTVLLGDGAGGFGPPQTFIGGASHLEIAVADLDLANGPDVATANFTSGGGVSVLFNRGDGTLGEAVDWATPDVTFPRSITAGDLDGDSDPDLVTGDGFVPGHVVLLNDGAGGFAATSAFDVHGTTSLVADLADFDGDLDLDPVFAFEGVSLFLNRGDATFGEPVLPSAKQFSSVVAGDFDGDGLDDFAAPHNPSTGSGAVRIFLNLGGGTSFDQTDVAVAGNTRDLTAADLDNDGDLDLAVTHVAGVNRLTVLLNDGAGGFAVDSEHATRNYPQSVFAGDVDGDGRIDLAVGNQFDDPPSVSLFLNVSDVPRPGDLDGDGVADADDACPEDPEHWARPSPARELRLEGAETTTLDWRAPDDPGGTVVRYDVLRSARPDLFDGADCIAADILVTTATDPEIPGAGFYYLVRSEGCGGNLGQDGAGTPRSGAACP